MWPADHLTVATVNETLPTKSFAENTNQKFTTLAKVTWKNSRFSHKLSAEMADLRLFLALASLLFRVDIFK